MNKARLLAWYHSHQKPIIISLALAAILLFIAIPIAIISNHQKEKSLTSELNDIAQKATDLRTSEDSDTPEEDAENYLLSEIENAPDSEKKYELKLTLGSTYELSGRPEDALNLYLELEKTEGLSDRQRYDLCYLISRVYSSLDDEEKQLEYLEKRNQYDHGYSNISQDYRGVLVYN